jgi:predicted O-linked N-acetylglucosamine transferase (SPINDLY family)
MAETNNNLGNALASRGAHRDAEVCFERALSIKPEFAEAYANLGNAFREQGRIAAALASYERALALEPRSPSIRSGRLLALTYSPAWSSAEILAEAEAFAALVEPTEQVTAWPNDRDPERKLRIGYVSGDFRRHPVGYFLSAVLASHDKREVDVFCYANSAQKDDLTERLRGHADHWRAITGLTDDSVARRIIADEIDILVDLSGHTAQNRLGLFARKPAPVQLSWLGYWGTTGLASMDYLLSDAVTVSVGEERFYSEQVIRLPTGRFCYAPPDYAPQPSFEPPMLRSGFVTFGSFNNLAKLGPDVARLWAEVLKAVPESWLLLKWFSLSDEAVRQRVQGIFKEFGISSDRLILRGRSPHADMLAEYGDIDIALDPFPFSGGLTSCEALWMGVPVVTLPGDAAPSRQTQGFLHTLGLDGWVATSAPDYVAIAAGLAADGASLQNFRRDLRSRMAASPLCDGPTFTRGLEAAFRDIWKRWCGEP